MNRGQLPRPAADPHRNGLARLSGRNPSAGTPHHIMYPAGSHTEPRTEVSPGVRGHTPAPQRAHAPPRTSHTRTDDHQRLDNPQAAQVSRARAGARRSSVAYVASGRMRRAVSETPAPDPDDSNVADATRVDNPSRPNAIVRREFLYAGQAT
jgi:hypothetical protein